MQIENLKEKAGNKDWTDEIADRLLDLAAIVIRMVSKFPRYNPGLHIGNQLMRSITSSGANYEEARGAESRADFIHKMQIVLKELRESLYWLKLLTRIDALKIENLAPAISEANHMANIIAKSIVTAKKGSGR
ncbi:MAG TPA: four helix bundle protein [Fibrobacteria bacterium]|nr:four helix bundle protein [Fibrobacteria bacterium]